MEGGGEGFVSTRYLVTTSPENELPSTSTLYRFKMWVEFLVNNVSLSFEDSISLDILKIDFLSSRHDLKILFEIFNFFNFFFLILSRTTFHFFDNIVITSYNDIALSHRLNRISF